MKLNLALFILFKDLEKALEMLTRTDVATFRYQKLKTTQKMKKT